MKRYLLALGLIFFFIACAKKKTVEIKPVEGLEEITVYEETTEETTTPAETTTVVIPPIPAPVEPVEPIVTIQPAETTVTYQPPTPVVPIPQPTAPAAPPTAYGFRIQIFASSSQENAERIANDAQQSFTEQIYVEPDGNLFKVRVGDFLTREDADKLKVKAAQLGFRGSFVVETMVNPK